MLRETDRYYNAATAGYEGVMVSYQTKSNWHVTKRLRYNVYMIVNCNYIICAPIYVVF